MTGGYPLFVFRLLWAVRVLGRRCTLGVAATVLAVSGAPVWPASALESGSAGAAAATQDGWWNRAQGPQEGEPAGNPIRPLVPRLPAPPTVPADGVAVGSVFGTPDKVAAVGIEVALPEGGVVDSLTLRLTEAPGRGANTNSETAKVLACPVTVPWGPDKNANWADRPQADCELARAEGVRAVDGTWTFDLTPMGALWAEPSAALAHNGVLLAVDPSGAPGVIQVSWLDFDSGNVAVDLVASVTPVDPGRLAEAPPAPAEGEVAPAPAAPPGTPAAIPFAAAAAPEPDPAAFSDPYAYAGGATSAGFGSFAGTADVPAPVASEEQATLLVAPRAEATDDALRIRPAVGFWEDVPAPTVVLVPVALGLALLIGLVLGPGGRPLPVWPRAGGLSRALARRDAGRPGAKS